MAALTRPTTASYQIHESVQVDTDDNEDHTFCGVAFPVKAHHYLPVERLEIHSVSVRGALGESMRRNHMHDDGSDEEEEEEELGDVTVWVSKEAVDEGTAPGGYNNRNFRLNKDHFEKIFDKKLKASFRSYVPLEFDRPIVLKPGQVRMLYVHSSAAGDDAIVYDNSQYHQRFRYKDDFLSIYSGKAHLSCTPFGNVPIWGWGNSWRDRREFVGQLQYGVTFKLWNPNKHNIFGSKFDKAVMTMLLLQRTHKCPVATLPDECVYYILNMCKWDWFDDDGSNLKGRYRVRKRDQRRLERERSERSESDDIEMDLVESSEVFEEAPADVDMDEYDDEAEEDEEDTLSEGDDVEEDRQFLVDDASSDEETDSASGPTHPHVNPRYALRFPALLRALGVMPRGHFNIMASDDDDDDDDEDYVEDNADDVHNVRWRIQD